MPDDRDKSFGTGPGEAGLFGLLGGRLVGETLMPQILELEAHHEHAKTDSDF